MQLTDRVKYCNGCSACVVPCKTSCIKMADGKPVINEDGCSKCNACTLFCPVFNPVDVPAFEEWYEFSQECYDRVDPKYYREIMRKARSGEHTEFVGTLCQIAGLISLQGGVVAHNLILKPMICDAEKREQREACQHCIFY